MCTRQQQRRVGERENGGAQDGLRRDGDFAVVVLACRRDLTSIAVLVSKDHSRDVLMLSMCSPHTPLRCSRAFSSTAHTGKNVKKEHRQRLNITQAKCAILLISHVEDRRPSDHKEAHNMLRSIVYTASNTKGFLCMAWAVRILPAEPFATSASPPGANL
jgi:hypothetical protein